MRAARQPEERPAESHPDLARVREALRGEPGGRGWLLDQLRCVQRILVAKNAQFGGPLDQGELEDLAQDTLLVVWKRLPSYEGRGALEAWLYRLCYLGLLTRLRRVRRHPRPPTDRSPDDSEEPTAPHHDPYEHEELYRGIDRVGPPEADILRLKHLEGLTFDEIGERLGLSPNTAKTRYYRGLDILRQILEQSGIEPEDCR